jgi:hypothetical protein
MTRRFEPTLRRPPGGEVAAPRAPGELAHLVEAVREHEQIASRSTVPKRPADHTLYRRLAEIEQSGADQRNGG